MFFFRDCILGGVVAGGNQQKKGGWGISASAKFRIELSLFHLFQVIGVEC